MIDQSLWSIDRTNISTVVNSDGQSLWPINIYIYTLVTVWPVSLSVHDPATRGLQHTSDDRSVTIVHKQHLHTKRPVSGKVQNSAQRVLWVCRCLSAIVTTVLMLALSIDHSDWSIITVHHGADVGSVYWLLWLIYDHYSPQCRCWLCLLTIVTDLSSLCWLYGP